MTTRRGVEHVVSTADTTARTVIRSKDALYTKGGPLGLGPCAEECGKGRLRSAAGAGIASDGRMVREDSKGSSGWSGMIDGMWGEGEEMDEDWTRDSEEMSSECARLKREASCCIGHEL